MGIVTQIFVMTGLAMNIVFFIKTLSGNVGILALILTMAVTILFGMGVPTTAAYVLVAKIAKSDYFKTAATATRLGLPGFILPFMFAYHQELFLMGNPISIISIVLSCAIGLFCMCACFEGYIFRKLTVVEMEN